jgi:hypothetical protein
MTAQEIYDTAPIGSVIRYADGADKPPARYRQKLRAWESRNGLAKLTEKHPGAPGRAPAHFVLTVDHGWLVTNTLYRLDSRLRFDIVSKPPVHNPPEPAAPATPA